MKLILLWLCVTSATAITSPLWSIYANGNFHPQHLHSYSPQQHHNDFQTTQNSPMFALSSQPLFLPNPIRFHQALNSANSQNFERNMLYSNQQVQNPHMLYITPNQGFVEYNPIINNGWIRPTKKRQNKKTKSKSQSKKSKHSFPVIYIDSNPERDNYRQMLGNTEESSASSDHEVPQEIPTKPIYPGEGQWAKRGKKHRPHITKHKFKVLEESTERDTGHEIFDKAKGDFEKQRNKFDKLMKHISHNDPETPTHNDYGDDYHEDTSSEEFVPYKTYSQVRHSEFKEHLSFPSPEDERLKESITDSKTHTVYTEEGYEDSAYDHADREKNADVTEVYDDAKQKTAKTKQSKPKESTNTRDDKNESDADKDARPIDLLSVGQQINSIYETTTPKMFKEENFTVAQRPDTKEESLKNPKQQNQNLTGQQIFSPIEIDYLNKQATKVHELPSISNKFLEDDLIDNMRRISVNQELSKNSSKNLRRKRRMTTEDTQRNKSETSATVHNDEKYPYYNLKSIEENSPLRYSENPSNIPHKRPGVMAFYNQADQVECEEVEKDVNPVPNQLSKSENISKSDDIEAPTARLGKLGDKIDCFKAKYFGENPLDNPLFKEDLIDVPSPIFKSKQIDSSKNKADEISHVLQDYINYEVTENIEDDLDDDDAMIEKIKETVTEDAHKTKVSDIILGRYLREDAGPNLKYLDDSKKLSDRSDSDDIPESSPYIMKRRRKPYRSSYRRTSVAPVIYSNNYKAQQTTQKPFSEVHYKDEIKHSEQLNVFADIINNIKTATKEADPVSSLDIQSIPVETTSIRSRPRRRKLPSRNYKIKTTTDLPFQISTKTLLNNYRFTSTARPSSKYNNIVSENQRYYENPTSETFSKVDSFNDKVELIRDNEVQQKPSLWTPMVVDGNNKIATMEVNGINENFIPTNHRFEDVTNKYEVHGLLPPREIYTHRPLSLSDSEAISNSFHVIGMRPPPMKSAKRRQNHVKKRRVTYPYRLRIVKRSARRGYSEIRRRGKQTEENPQQEEEEYVPHRPRTYHYDTEARRIVYDKKPESEETEQESYEYVDVVEEVTQAAKSKKEKKEERVLKFPEKPPEGPQYTDFIAQLKSDPRYHEIPDPKPTEKTTTTLTPSTETPVSTTEPEFLSILAKIRSDTSYKTIEDEKKSKSKAANIEASEIEEVEEEEDVLKDVQNSPGGQVNSFASSQLDFFDISEYMPKVKNYSPSTNIDTSKYKSIERVTITRHNSDSRYSSEDETKEDDGGIGDVATTSSQSLSLRAPTSTNTPTAPLPKPEKQEVQEQSGKTTSRGRQRSTTTHPPVEDATEKPSPRRSRGRSRFRSTTLSPAEEIRKSTRRRRNLQRKHEKNSIPRNHKSHYSAVEPDGSTPKVKANASSRAITIETLKETNITNMPPENVTKKADDVEIFKEFDRTQKHGGNYKYKKLEIRVSQGGINYVPPTAYEIEDSEEIKRLTDIVPKPFAFYSDPKLPSRINSLTESNNRDREGEGIRDELQFFEDAARINSESTTGKPNFIKDPSKRLYFYAPI